HPVALAPGAALADPVEVPDWVVHRLHLAPVLPGPRQGLRGRFPAPFTAVRRDEGATEAGFGEREEGREVRPGALRHLVEPSVPCAQLKRALGRAGLPRMSRTAGPAPTKG